MARLFGFRKTILFSLFLLTAFYRAFSIFALRGINCSSNWLSPILPCNWAGVPLEMVLWAVVISLFLLELRWDHAFPDFFRVCVSMWPAFVFVLLAALSSLWSIVYTITLYKTFVLLVTTVIAIYLGRVFDMPKLLDFLLGCFTVVIVACYAFVLFLPKIGIMVEPFYRGAWEGIFWHRNYLGCFMALGISIFLLKLLDWKKLSTIARVGIPIMLVLAIFLLVKAKSATGIITALILAIFCFLVYIWIKNEKHIKPVHYYIVAAVIVIVAALALTHLGFLFGLLGRDTSLTGRVPMWRYLIQNVINKRPLLGYGYGVVWSLEGFRTQLGTILNWGFPVLIGDNGFIDIWLHLGLVGLLFLLTLIAVGFIRAAKYVVKEKTVISMLPLIIMAFVVVANISLSMILETETFVWSIAIASQVAIGSLLQKRLTTL